MLEIQTFLWQLSYGVLGAVFLCRHRAVLTHLAMGGCCCWCFCLPFYSAPFRERLRKKRNLAMDPCSDLHTHIFCHPCALCQESRELTVVANVTGVATPPTHTIDRTPEDTVKHLELVRNQNMER